jgi:hypothetical protein
MIFKLLTDSLLWLYVILIGSLAVNTELLVSPGKFQVLSNYFSSFVSFRKIDWHASDPAHVLSQLCSACCVLGVWC